MNTKNAHQTAADPRLLRRVDALADRMQKDKTEVLNDVLRCGLDWGEDFVERVRLGIDAADRGDFATPEEVDRVFNKYQPE